MTTSIACAICAAWYFVAGIVATMRKYEFGGYMLAFVGLFIIMAPAVYTSDSAWPMIVTMATFAATLMTRICTQPIN